MGGVKVQLAGLEHNPGAGSFSCAIYQDIAIPAGATTAYLDGQWALKTIAPKGFAGVTMTVGLFTSTVAVPNSISPQLGGAGYFSMAPDAALQYFA